MLTDECGAFTRRFRHDHASTTAAVFSMLLGILSATPTFAQYVYWGAFDVRRAHLDSSASETVVDTNGAPRISVDSRNAFLFYIGVLPSPPFTSGVVRTQLDGTDAQLLADWPGGSANGIAADPENRMVYWYAGNPEGTIYRTAYDGGASEVVTTAGCKVGWDVDLAIDTLRGKLYWISNNQDLPGGCLYKANLDGSDAHEITPASFIGFSGSNPWSLAVDSVHAKIYWGASGRIWRANLDGTEDEQMFGGLQQYIEGLAVDPREGKLYWVENDNNGPRGPIRRANIDGTGLETVANEEGLGIALYLPPPPPAACCLGDGSCFDGLTDGECADMNGEYHPGGACGGDLDANNQDDFCESVPVLSTFGIFALGALLLGVGANRLRMAGR